MMRILEMEISMKNRNRKGTGIIAPAAALLICLAGVQAVMGAEGRKGANVIVTQAGSVQKGELVGVRPESLVILADSSVLTFATADIESVRIVNKVPKILAGWVGSFVGAIAGIGVAKAFNVRADDLGDAIGKGALFLGGGAIVGAVAGVLLADKMAPDELIVFKNKSNGEIGENLERLRKRARVHDYR